MIIEGHAPTGEECGTVEVTLVLQKDGETYWFWEPSRTAVFGVRVVHVGAPLYLENHALNDATLWAHKHSKKRKYVSPCA